MVRTLSSALGVSLVTFLLVSVFMPYEPPIDASNARHRKEYDSGWISITDKAGQYFDITHNLNSLDVEVDITGKTTADGGIHQRNLGGTCYTPGWSKTYGSTTSERGHDVVQTSDGGYALIGSTGLYPSVPSDIWLVKTDWAGNLQWNRTYGGPDQDYGFSIIETNDQGYVLFGSTTSFGAGDDDLWLVKTDANGNMQWNKTYGGPKEEFGGDFVQTNDGGYAMVSHTSSYGAGSIDFWLVKTDAAGNMQWNKTYGGPSQDNPRSVLQTVDGGYVLVGHTWSSETSWDLYLVKTDSDGNLGWNRTHGGPKGDFGKSVIQTKDGGYMIAGDTGGYVTAGNDDFWLVKTDNAGNVQWDRTYGGPEHDILLSFVETFDGGYALVGHTSSFGAGDSDLWLVKTDVAGNMQWNKTYGGPGEDVASEVVQTKDGGCVMVGSTETFGFGRFGSGDFWLVKTDFEHGLAWTDSTANSITLYRGATDAYWNYVRVRISKNKKTP